MTATVPTPIDFPLHLIVELVLALVALVLLSTGGIILMKELCRRLKNKFFSAFDGDYVTKSECDGRRASCQSVTALVREMKGTRIALQILILHSNIPKEDQERALRELEAR